MVWMAQPWGDNYAYQSWGGYLFLAGFIAWALAPYALIAVLQRRLPVTARGTLLGALYTLIALAGVAVAVDVAFIHIDAQGALVFIFLPVYQLVAVLVVVAVNALLPGRDVNRK